MAHVEAFDQFAVAVARDTWTLFRRDPGLFVVAGLAMAAAIVCTLGLLSGPLSSAYLDMVRKVRDDEPVAVSSLFSRMDTLVPSSIALLVFVVSFSIGIWLVIPAFLVVLGFVWAMPAIAFDNMGGIDAIRYSVSLVRAHPGHALAMVFGLIVMHMVGGMVVFGFVITMPLGTIATALAYQRVRALPILEIPTAG